MNNEPDQARTNQVNELIEQILKTIDEALSKGFRPTERNALPSSALAGIDPWRADILRQGGENESNLAYSFHVSNYPVGDVVRIERKQAGLKVVEFHTPLAMLVWVDREPQAPAPLVRMEDYDGIARSLFNVASAFHPRPAAPSEQGVAVSTAPTRSVYSMPSWSERVDAGFRQGHLHFIFYHRSSTQSIGIGTGERWFDDEFRRKNR